MVRLVGVVARWGGDGVADEWSAVFVGEGECVGVVGVAGDVDLAAVDEVVAGAAGGVRLAVSV